VDPIRGRLGYTEEGSNDMIPTERPLDNPINWSFRAGRVWGIDVRVHLTFVICAIVLLWMELPKPGSGQATFLGRAVVDAFGTYAILFAVVLLHEFGHCFGARYVGGDADEILLWPLGGLASVNPPHHPRAHAVTTIAGPMVNVILCAICSGVLAVWIGSLGAVPWNPLHPTSPVDESIVPTTGQLWVMRFYGMSYFILLVNMLPIFPFDGGRLVHAWLWPRKGYRAATEIATGTGMVGAIVVGLCGLFTEQSWLLMMIAVFGYVTCWQTRRSIREHADSELEDLGYDFSGGYTSLQRGERRERRPGYWERRRTRRTAARVEKLRRLREQHHQAVEEVLKKVSIAGMDSLTAKERRILEEETLRQRDLMGL